jgi:curli biogenesis system outer membrane secretion channel CsgG
MNRLFKIVIALLLVCFASTAIKAQGKMDKPTLAVLPFVLEPNNIQINVNDKEIKIQIVESEFADQLLQNLVKSRKFSVLERANVDKIMRENKLTESDYIKAGEEKRIGQLLVADYLVVGHIDRVEFFLERKFIEITKETSIRLKASMKVHFRVVETKSGKIVCAHSITKKLDSRDIPAQERKNMTGGDYRDMLFSNTATAAATYILEGIYPVKIASVQGDSLVINRGEGTGINVGGLYEVYAQGEAVKDPDTGDIIGSDETKVGLIEITSVQQKFSKAKIVKSEGSLTVGAICRQVEKKQKNEEPATPRATPGW